MTAHFTKPFNPINWPAVPHDFTGDNVLGIYATETTQRYVYGTRYLTWDGRVYKYMGVTTAGVTTYSGLSGTLSAQTEYVTAVAADVGSRVLTVPDVTTVAEDLLAGGMVLVYDSTAAQTRQYHIVGNDIGDGTNIRIYLEFPLAHLVTVSDSIEMYANQYRAVEGTLANAAFRPHLGVSMSNAATGYNIWAQTWGPCHIQPGNTTMDDAAENERMAHWAGNSTMMEVDDATVTAGKNQVAGYIWNAGTAGIAGPQIYLMCSI